MSCCDNPQCITKTAEIKSEKKLLTCARCRKTNYCNRQCQAKHWPEHKSGCFSKNERQARRDIVKQTTTKSCNVCEKTAKSTGSKLLSCSSCFGVRYCSEVVIIYLLSTKPIHTFSLLTYIHCLNSSPAYVF